MCVCACACVRACVCVYMCVYFHLIPNFNILSYQKEKSLFYSIILGEFQVQILITLDNIIKHFQIFEGHFKVTQDEFLNKNLTLYVSNANLLTCLFETIYI